MLQVESARDLELMCRRVAAAGRARHVYPVSVGSFAFSHPAMPSGITKALG